MTPVVTQTPAYNPLVIGAHTLWKLYPPKIAEAEIKDIDETGEIVLSRVVIPETIIVHDGLRLIQAPPIIMFPSGITSKT